MLGKMLLHGVAGAILIGSAAAVYAQVGDGGTPPPVPAPSAQREHRFPDRVWANPKVVTRSNRPACHAAAEQGSYEDD